jgi:hypothetical protein
VQYLQRKINRLEHEGSILISNITTLRIAMIDEGELCIVFVRSENNPANIMTKNVSQGTNSYKIFCTFTEWHYFGASWT